MTISSFIYLFTAALLGLCESSSLYTNFGTFEKPSAHVRPRFKYWIPDASVNLSRVQADVADAGRVGAGGIELLGYYNYGDIEGGAYVIPTDWTKYGWGTPAWRQLQDAALQATKDNDMIIDLALGPNQGAGVPAPVDVDGLQWDLQPFNVSVPVGDHFHSILPGWGTGPLVSASTGLVTESAEVNSVLTNTLATSSLQDVTNEVASNGMLDIKFPSNAKGKNFVVFAYYLVHSEYREEQTPELVISGKGVHQSPVRNYVQNGSWVVDHFSAKGAQAIADFWNSQLLNGGDSAQLVKEVGNYVWEDSQEFPANVLWTPNLPSTFKTNRGYSITKYLPILLYGNTGVSLAGPPASGIFVTDEADAGAGHVEDYRQTVTELNAEYLKGLTKFAQSIGVQSSAQVVYNLPMDMLANIPDVDAPECESLGFGNNIDGYRQFAGPANLAGKRVISSECGAFMYTAYQLPISELLWAIKRSFVGGVNAFVLHGMPFSGYYPNTTWPSYTTFTYVYSEMHNRHQPGWDFYRDFIDYTSRVMYTMQTGVPKIDLAFWLKSTSDFKAINTQYLPSDLELAGYTYEYLSPDDFSLPNAYVKDGVLAPTEQAFKVLIVRGNDTLTSSGVSKLAQWAKQGLPVVFSGGLPSNISGYASPSELSSIRATLSKLKSLHNVHVVPYDNLAGTLASLGIHPRAAISADSPSNYLWYTRWLESSAETSVIVYYDTTGAAPGLPSSNATVTFASTGKPYIYDAWTGTQTPLVQYTQTQDTTTIPLSLAGNQTVIVAFKQNSPPPYPYIEHSSGPIDVHMQSSAQPTAAVVVSSAGESSTSLQLSNGTTVTAPGQSSAPITLSNWTLTIESWSPPSNLFDIDGTVKKNHTYKIDTLLPWHELDVGTNLTYVSGRGYYQSTFHWPPAESKSPIGAVLSLSPILHTAVLYLNNQRMPPLDVTAPQADISHSLKKGINTVEIVVSTQLGNAMIPIVGDLLTAGAPPSGTGLIVVTDNGLVGEVTVKPYNGVML